MNETGERVLTVRGPIDAADMGRTLPHEHVMCDFVGADQTGRHRWQPGAVVSAIEPLLREIRRQGVRSFVDCTPMYLGRDPRVLLELSRRTDLHILTNTGMYKEPFLPSWAFTRSAEQLAADWIAEFREGIESTGVRPGFIKTAVERQPLAPMQRTVISAAAVTSRETGLCIATHTGAAVAAEQILDILDGYGIEAERWIFVHAQNEQAVERVAEIGRRGAWIELDGIAPQTAEKHAELVLALLEEGLEDRLLLSQDAGWYTVGALEGGEIRGYGFLFGHFVPLLCKCGVPESTVDKITVTNPARAFRLRGERKAGA